MYVHVHTCLQCTRTHTLTLSLHTHTLSLGFSVLWVYLCIPRQYYSYKLVSCTFSTFPICPFIVLPFTVLLEKFSIFVSLMCKQSPYGPL